MHVISILLRDNHRDVAGHLSKLFLLSVIFCALVCSSASPQQPPDTKVQSQAPDSKAGSQPAKPSTPTKRPRRNKTRKPSHPTRRSLRNTVRFRKIHQAFVGSATLKPMALQLLQNRVPAAYAGVESYARKHNAEDAGSLAWLAVGYAYFLDHQYPRSIDALNHAKAHGTEIGDYIAYYLASSQLQSGRTAEALRLLSKFDDTFPESLLIRDAHVLYAGALINSNRVGRYAASFRARSRSQISVEFS